VTRPDPDQLSADALRRLLHAAVEPIQPGPEAYTRLRDRVARRRNRWVVPVAAAGALALAGIVALSVLLIRQAPSVVTVSPPFQTFGNGGTPGGGGSGDNGAYGGGTKSSGHPTTTPSRSASPPVASASPTASVSATRSPGDGSPQRPTPVATPATPGDVDGDGTVDPVTVSGTSLVISLSRGGTATAPLPGATLGRWTAVDVDGDGFAEVIVETGSSGGVVSYAMVKYLMPGELSVLPAPPGARFAAGTAGDAGWGFRCVNNAIAFVSGTSSDNGQSYAVTTTTLRPNLYGWDTVAGPVAGTMTAAAAAAAFTAGCGNLG
jgi:hypothetical protein